MSRALKCDKCKKCFDPYAEGVEFIRFDDIVLQDDETFGVNGCILREDLQHLCPECTNEFLDWFDKDHVLLEKRSEHYLRRRRELLATAKITDPLTENGRSV